MSKAGEGLIFKAGGSLISKAGGVLYPRQVGSYIQGRCGLISKAGVVFSVMVSPGE